MDQKRRIGIYGGTFDPVHVGHLAVAKKVSELFEIDEIIFVPALQAPHKLKRAVTSHLHRYAMLALATQSEPKWRLSTVELEAPQRPYTVDTVAHFQSQLSGSELFFIMGADSWAEITTWREWKRLLQMTNHIVVTRPGFELRMDHVPSSLRARISVTDAVMVDVSATEVRRAANERRLDDLKRMVPEAVAEYIGKHSLYREVE